MGSQRVGHNLVTEQQSVREATKPLRQGGGQGGAAGLWGSEDRRLLNAMVTTETCFLWKWLRADLCTFISYK